INECSARSHTCGHGFDCVNTDGSFRCAARPQCPAGFGQDPQGRCVGGRRRSRMEEEEEDIDGQEEEEEEEEEEEGGGRR
ncbi:hypothetical protein CRUP_012784, partial [Coryphaenoides rupestris]